jgi:hypothetical protein
MSAILSLTMQQQAKAYWCWAAVASSVATYLGASDPIDVKTQCQIAQMVLAGAYPTCATDCQNPNCNVTFRLDSALNAVRHMNGLAYAGYPSFAWIAYTILNDRLPIGVRLGAGTYGHFVLIVGYDDDGGAQDLFVADPQYTTGSYTQRIAYTSITQQYGGLAWTNTYPIQ